MISGLLLLIGYLMLLLASISGVGYCLYEWAVAGVAFKYAAWSGFKLWLSMTMGGFISLMIGIYQEEMS